jgi:hypothetical protein
VRMLTFFRYPQYGVLGSGSKVAKFTWMDPDSKGLSGCLIDSLVSLIHLFHWLTCLIDSLVSFTHLSHLLTCLIDSLVSFTHLSHLFTCLIDSLVALTNLSY